MLHHTIQNSLGNCVIWLKFDLQHPFYNHQSSTAKSSKTLNHTTFGQQRFVYTIYICLIFFFVTFCIRYNSHYKLSPIVCSFQFQMEQQLLWFCLRWFSLKWFRKPISISFSISRRWMFHFIFFFLHKHSCSHTTTMATGNWVYDRLFSALFFGNSLLQIYF